MKVSDGFPGGRHRSGMPDRVARSGQSRGRECALDAAALGGLARYGLAHLLVTRYLAIPHGRD
jgi:hypothetical protein